MVRYIPRIIIFLVRAFIDVFLVWPDEARQSLLTVGFFIMLFSILAALMARFSMAFNFRRNGLLRW